MDQSGSLRAWGASLKAARKASGLSQLDVCRETGAAPAAVYRWEAGRVRPQARFVRKLREIFPTLPELPELPVESPSSAQADDSATDAA